MRGVVTRVLHFKVKNAPLKDKKWKERVKKNAQFSFCRGREAFRKEIVYGVFSLQLSAWSVLKCNQAAKFLLNFQVHFALYGHENYVLER